MTTRIGRIGFAGLVVWLCLASVTYGQATYQVVKGFDLPPRLRNGTNPLAGVIQSTDGSFYGTTQQGGASDHGTVFKIDAAGRLTMLHSFTGGSDGAYPAERMVQATDGAFYGTTSNGGQSGGGTVFKIDGSGILTTFYSFNGGSDGASPSSLIQASDGNFYGTTARDNTTGGGTVFKLDAAGALTTLHHFSPSSGGTNGWYPEAGVIEATDGSFYGTTLGGGAAFGGTVFKINAAGTLTTIHGFDFNIDGGYLFSRLIQATDGSFYGTTFRGGPSGGGTIFKIDAAGTLTTLHNFTSGSVVDGVNPYAGVIQASDGSFYGTTLSGGASGAGTVFRLDAAGTLTTIHSFTRGSDGTIPHGGLIQAADGTLCGTTSEGGPSGGGTVFKLDAAGTLTTLHGFGSSTGASDGRNPYAGVMQASDGSFYGSTYRGGAADVGTVFKLDGVGTLTTLHSFAHVDGSYPTAGLIQASDGSFYGTTTAGGSPWSWEENAVGTVFKLGGPGSLTTLYTFSGLWDGAYFNGAYPLGGLIQATDGSLYGTTSQGGVNEFDSGTVFAIDGAGRLTQLHSFTGGIDGGWPWAGVIQATDGSFYGTTAAGGVSGVGTVFKLDAAGTLTTLHTFTGGDGAYPTARLLQAADGSFYGTTAAGGAASVGTVFKLDGAGTLTTLHSFTGGDGASPYAGVIQGTDGSFFGTTNGGGASNVGTVFKLDAAGTLTTLHSFTGGDGAYPYYAGVIQATDGSLYGTTYEGGPTDGGVVFKLTLGQGDPPAPLTPTITFGTPPAPTYLGGHFTVSAVTTNTDSSALSYVAVSGPCAVVDASAGTFSSTGAGVCRVEARGAATANFLAASAQQDVTIAKAAASVTLSNLIQTYTGSPLSPTATTTPAGLTIVWTNAPQTDSANYAAVTATVNDSNYEGSASGTFVIEKAAATVALSDLIQTYTGNPLSPTATTTPAGLTIDWTNAPQTNPGNYAVTATVNDSNYQGSAGGTFLIETAAATVHVGDLDRTSTTQATKWTAMVTIKVHGSSHALVANATVSGSWNNGSGGSCTTNANGQCVISRSGIVKTKSSVNFTVTNVARATLVYTPADNHDPDGDSNGISVTIFKP